MKRLIVMLLFVALLCGCSATQAPPAMQESSATQEPPYEKETLQGGIIVHTDYSKYGPQAVPEQNYTRLSPEFISELQPRDDYGMLYPFVGSLTQDDYLSEPQYGMVDENGRIAVDAVYTYVAPAEAYRYDAYEGEPIPIWVMQQTVGAQEDVSKRYLIATFDGSFVSEPIYSYVEVYEDYVFGFVLESGKTNITHVFDKTGKLCLDSEKSPLAPQFAVVSDSEFYYYPQTGIISYGSGLFQVRLPNGSYFADWDGNLICGPYAEATHFSDGCAMVEKKTGNYAYIDTEGNELWDMEFSYADVFRNGYAAATTLDGQQALLSANDGIVLVCDGDNSNVYRSVFNVWDEEVGEYFYDLTGELLFAPTDDHYYNFLDNGIFLQDQDCDTVTNIKTGKVFYGEEYGFISYFESWADYPYLSFRVWKDEKSTNYIADADFNILLQTSSYVFLSKDDFTQKDYFLTEGASSVQIYNTEMEELLTLRGKYCRMMNGRVLCYDDYGSYYYDMEGNLLFCYFYPAGNGD